MSKRILITGSNSFLGKNLVRELKTKGYELFFIRRKSSVKNDNEILWDFKSDLPLLPKVDVIVHLAAYVYFGQEFQEQQYQVNTMGTAKISEQASKQGACLIFASMAGVHGIKGQLGPKSYIAPVNHYGISKWLAEEWIKHLTQRWIILRIGGVYGLDGPVHLGLNRSLTDAYYKQLVPTINGAGKGKRNYINVEDAAKWISLLCSQSNPEKQLLYMASSEVLTIREYLHKISDTLVGGRPLTEGPGQDGEDMVIESSPSPVKLTLFEDYLKGLHKQRMADVHG